MSGDTPDNRPEMARLHSTFKTLDSDGDGRIRGDDLLTLLLGQERHRGEAVLRRQIGAADGDGDGLLDYAGFVTVMAGEMSYRDLLRDLDNVFSALDSDGDGFITTAELARMKPMIGENASQDEIDEMIRAADKNHDGRVSRDEFVAMIVKSE